jgi:fructose-specific phosphotransferase system IIC component
VSSRLRSLAAALATAALGAAIFAPQAHADVAPGPSVDTSLIIITVAVVGAFIVAAVAWVVLRRAKRDHARQMQAATDPAGPGTAAEVAPAAGHVEQTPPDRPDTGS